MGQAIVDPPDPTEAPLPSVGADDLLAKMAGEEIDRLLAEAEEDAPRVRKLPAKAIDPPSPAPSVEKTSDGSIQPPVQSSSPAAAAATSAIGVSSSDNLASELDSLLDSLANDEPPPRVPTPVPLVEVTQEQLKTEAPAAPAAPTIAGPEEPVIAIGAATVVAPPAVETAVTGAADETTAAERSALAAGEAASETAAPTVEALPESTSPQREQAGEPSRLQRLLLLPLELINAPLAACPDPLREFVGKAAILTAANAIAVIFYVRFIRRH